MLSPLVSASILPETVKLPDILKVPIPFAVGVRLPANIIKLPLLIFNTVLAVYFDHSGYFLSLYFILLENDTVISYSAVIFNPT